MSRFAFASRQARRPFRGLLSGPGLVSTLARTIARSSAAVKVPTAENRPQERPLHACLIRSPSSMSGAATSSSAATSATRSSPMPIMASSCSVGRPGAGDPAAVVVQDDPGPAAGRKRGGGRGGADDRTARAVLRVAQWRGDPHGSRDGAGSSALGLAETDLRCGPQMPDDPEAATATAIAAVMRPSQVHNNCSGKHTGFLTLTKHLARGAGVHRPRPPGAEGRPRGVRGRDRRSLSRLRDRRLLGPELRHDRLAVLPRRWRAIAAARRRAMPGRAPRSACVTRDDRHIPSWWRAKGGPAPNSCGRWTGAPRSRPGRRASSSRSCPSGGSASR